MSALSPFERFKIKVTGPIDRIKGSCIFMHRYAPWTIFREGDISAGPKDSRVKIGYYVEQRRVCDRCGRIEIRSVQTKIV